MIAIKMDMPKSCKGCNGIDGSGYTHYCIFGKFKFSEVETGNFYNKSGYKHPNCPLIALPEENKDMSWEELVNIIELNLKTEVYSYAKIKVIYSNISELNNMKYIQIKSVSGLECINFFYNGIITISGIDIKSFQFEINIKPFKMFQIIKALIGDER